MSLMFYSVINEGRHNVREPLNPKSIHLRLLRTDENGPTETIDVPMTVPQAMSALTQLSQAVEQALMRSDIRRSLGNTDPKAIRL